jgi:uncharacterized membrane protein
MDAKQFVNSLKQDAITAAIRDVEEKSTGGIRIFISRKKPRDAMRAAQRRFVRLELDQPESRNFVLLYIAPRSHKFAIVGDREINAKCGDVFWVDTVNGASAFFSKREFTEGILYAVQRVGQALTGYFPRQASKA